MSSNRIQHLIEEIFNLYELYGSCYCDGNNISYLHYKCQAAWIAMQEGYEDEIVLAAFLHDIVYMIPHHDESESLYDVGMIDAEEIGAAYLRKMGFSDALCNLVQSYSKTIRYLIHNNPLYYMQLSGAGKQRLESTGGRMHIDEATRFESDSQFDLCLKIWQWDEAAKSVAQPLPLVNILRSKAIKHLEKNLLHKVS